MYQQEITEREAGQRLDRYLYKLLPEAGSGFLHKMLRKKNIILNDRKAQGNEVLASGDQVKLFFAEETLHKFMGREPSKTHDTGESFIWRQAYERYGNLPILYENEHILLVDKPAGLLTQKAGETDLSLNEWLAGYLFSKGELSDASPAAYKPSACNRLDRNTSGIVLCAKSVRGAQLLGDLLKERTLHKYYRLYVKGRVESPQTIEGYLTKDEAHNKVTIRENPPGKEQTASYIKTRYQPLKQEADKTLLEVELITGKPHQIRAHLASIGHPLLGDYKYGDKAWNDRYKKTCHIEAQLLHACRVEFPELEVPFADISERSFSAEMPPVFAQAADMTFD